MREIKFRGYDNENKCWRFGSLARLQEGVRKFWAIICENLEYGGFERFYIHNKKTIGQYTGYIDGNKLEVYDGDIIKYQNGNLATIEWDYRNAGWICRSINQKIKVWNLIDSLAENALVIGNIHENPELLKN